jgi:UPF0755 protein
MKTLTPLTILRALYRTWFTGLLYILAGIGHVVYGILIGMRIMQRRMFVSAILLAVLAAASAVVYLFIPLRPLGSDLHMSIEKGASLRLVARTLSREKVVPSSRALVLWMKLRGVDTKIKAGEHFFNKYEGTLRAARHLLVALPADSVVTIPEGLTIEQTAQEIAQRLTIDTIRFIALCRDTGFIRSLEVEGATLEGFLFPDTYRFAAQTQPEEIIRRMVLRFETVYAGLPQTDISARYTQMQIMTLASIVEKEAALAEEQGHIAGVFHNRLIKGYPLGADPTVRYIYRKFSGALRVSELKNPSPYNTRVNSGLPPGPICSPGRGALAAAVSPMETKDLYFVAKWDGSGSHDFSATNAEHDRKKMEIRRQNELRIRQKDSHAEGQRRREIGEGQE